MSYEINLRRALDELRRANGLVRKELQDYGPLSSSPDANYDHLVGQRNLIDEAIRTIATPRPIALQTVQPDKARAERR